MITDNFPCVVAVMKKTVQKDEEITINYNWQRGKREYLSVCKCSSDHCRMFVEQDAALLMDKTINNIQKINIDTVTNIIDTAAVSNILSLLLMNGY